MRQLSRIVFVNSANIRYGEVHLDGNVHLIGTQGVGKSTVLRAILFFYTGDKMHLGISREKKSFDDFYLPGANSYIAYEVESEFGAFTVLVFRSHAHSVFRFIGAPFRREWLIDEQGEVTADSSVIRRRLDGAPMTRIVDEYQEYRDIIYGNKRVTDKEFARFCIMETAKYQNIPRSLQNVFLGAKVDADFIKDIIIRSLGDEEPGIDLVYFRSQLAGFEREYNDISLWFLRNKQGEVTVRRQGEKVVELYRKLLCLDNELTASLLELRHARRYAQERIPLLGQQVEETEILQQKCKEKLADLQDKYNHELSGLERELGVLNDKLEKIPRLRKKYEDLGIQKLLEEAGQETALQASLESARALRSSLTREYADITAKYKGRERELRLGFDAWRAARQGRKVEIGAALNAQIQKLSDALQAGISGIEEAFRERLLAQESLVSDLKERMAAEDKELALSAHLSPFSQEIKAAQAELSRLSGEKGVYTGAPIRQEILHGDRARGMRYFGLKEGRPVLMVVGVKPTAPPVKAMPPRMAAEMTFISGAASMMELGLASLFWALHRRPPRQAMTLFSRKRIRRVRSGFRPLRRAACWLPPTMKMLRPKRV